eukprot:1156951-Pelagomonas_calceolata.AAC.12
MHCAEQPSHKKGAEAQAWAPFKRGQHLHSVTGMPIKTNEQRKHEAKKIEKRNVNIFLESSKQRVMAWQEGAACPCENVRGCQ